MITEIQRCENDVFVLPVYILTGVAPASWAARHTTVCLDLFMLTYSFGKPISLPTVYFSHSILSSTRAAMLLCIIVYFLKLHHIAAQVCIISVAILLLTTACHLLPIVEYIKAVLYKVHPFVKQYTGVC